MIYALRAAFLVAVIAGVLEGTAVSIFAAIASSIFVIGLGEIHDSA